MDEAQYLALSPKQREELQRQWQQQGIYAGPIDGKSGNGVRTALGVLRSQQGNQAQTQTRNNEIELERERLREQAKKDEEERERKKREEELNAQREKDADPLMDTFAPFAAGAGVGGLYGEMTNRGLNAYEAGNARALSEISRELGPTRNLTGSQLNRSRAAGAAQAAERFAPSSALAKALGGAGRALSYGIPAGVVYNEYSNYQGRASDPKLTDKERKANQQIANGLLGVTTGIGVEGGRRFFFPSRPEGMGTAQMRIDTARDFASRMDASDAAKAATPPPAPPKEAAAPKRQNLPGSRGDLMEQARRYGIRGRSNMTQDELRSKVAEAITTTQAPRGGAATKALKALGPIAAGAVAADATYNQARAGGSNVAEALGEAAPNAVVAGGTAAGTGYGISKLAEALGPMAGKALGMTGSMMGPMAAGDMTDMSQEDLNQGRNWMARNAPALAIGPGMSQAYDMAQVPEPSPMRSVVQEQERPMPNAEALEIPADIPPNAAQQAEMQAQAFAPRVQNQLDRMIRLGAPPEAVAKFLNMASR